MIFQGTILFTFDAALGMSIISLIATRYKNYSYIFQLIYLIAITPSTRNCIASTAKVRSFLENNNLVVNSIINCPSDLSCPAETAFVGYSCKPGYIFETDLQVQSRGLVPSDSIFKAKCLSNGTWQRPPKCVLSKRIPVANFIEQHFT